MIRFTTACHAIVAVALVAAPTQALVLKTWNGPGTPASVNDSAPADDPGWANLPTNENLRTGIYLGDQWVVIATHAAGGDYELGGGVFPRINGSGIRLTNPATFAGQAPDDNETDLTFYRIGVDTTTGLTPEELTAGTANPIRRIQIADRLPSSDDVLTLFGRGGQRFVNSGDSNGQFHWNANGTEVTTTEVAAEHGFKTDNSRGYRWGQNKIANPSGVSGNPVRTGNQLLIRVDLNNNPSTPQVKDTIGFVTQFDRGLTDTGSPLADGSLFDEAQGDAGDSGGPVFWKDDDQWVLAGVMHAIYQDNNQNPGHAWFGNHTAISDFSFDHYYDQIEAIRSNVLYSYEGDIDLDGVATGDILGSTATGDLGILVDNWQMTFAEAGRESWIKGDLNQDAKVDLADFVLMRSALGGAISSASFAAAIRASVIPEPSTALLLVFAGGASVWGRRRPRGGC